jgi:hypothetical protein
MARVHESSNRDKDALVHNPSRGAGWPEFHTSFEIQPIVNVFIQSIIGVRPVSSANSQAMVTISGWDYIFLCGVFSYNKRFEAGA